MEEVELHPLPDVYRLANDVLLQDSNGPLPPPPSPQFSGLMRSRARFFTRLNRRRGRKRGLLQAHT